MVFKSAGAGTFIFSAMSIGQNMGSPARFVNPPW